MQERAAGGSRFNPMSGTWPMVIFDLVVVVALAALASPIASLSNTPWIEWTVFIAVTSVLVLVFVAVPLRVLLLAQRTDSESTTRALTLQNERQRFDARLGRALEMADSEPVALTMASRGAVDVR